MYIFNPLAKTGLSKGLTKQQLDMLKHFVYNPTTDKLEADRAIETTLNSLFLGDQHKMSSGSENIYFTNLTSKIDWYPVWGGVKDQSLAVNQDMSGVYNPTGRVFSEYNVLGLGGLPVSNTSIAYDGDNFFSFNISGMGITTRVAEAVAPEVRLKYELSVNGTAVYVQFLEHTGLAVNEDLTWYFDHPLDIVAGSTNHASITKIDADENSLGLLQVCQGDDGTNRYQTNVINRLFEDKNVAFTEDLEALDVVGFYDLYVDATFSGTSTGTNLAPYTTIEAAVNASTSGDKIFVKGLVTVSAEVVLPHSLHFYGIDGTEIKYATYDSANGNIFKFTGTGNTQEFTFKNIKFSNAGEYALKIVSTASVNITDCEFTTNGWNGTGLNTVLSSTATGILGYNSTQAELQAFYAGANASNGGAMRIENATTVRVIGNTVAYNLRGIRVQDCGVNGAGFITRNVATQNIESGIYIAAGSLGGCHNITTTMNVSSYNANNGLLCIGGINNKFSQNEVNGNWNAGMCGWGSANLTLRDCGLYNNNRSTYNGIGNVGDAKASIQINDAYNLLGTQITYNPDFRFIAEILDTQVHYTGLGSNTEKIGFLITSAVGALADNPKNIIKIDDVGFIGQDYAIDLSEVDVTNLRLSLGDNSYQSIGLKAVKAPIAGNYSELPFSNHVMQVPEVDVVVDTLKQTIALHEGVGGNVINTYKINELATDLKPTTLDIIQKASDKIQLRDLTFGNIYINGVVAGNTLNSANDSLNAAFNMNLVQYKDFLVSEVGVNGDASSGGSLPAIANNWYISYGTSAGTQITTPTIGNAFRNYNPFYNGEALEKGHEFIWTHNPSYGYMIGIWGAAEVEQAGSAALQPSNWSQGFAFNGSLVKFSQSDSSGVTIQQNGSIANSYDLPNGQLAIRFGQDNYLYLYEIVNGGYSLIGKSNSTIAGTSVMIQWASFNQGSFPVMTERTETWEIVHDYDSSQNGEWSNGLEESTIIKSRVSVNPGEKLTLNFNYFGRSETIGFGYTGTATGQLNAQDLITSQLFYNSAELIRAVDGNANGTTWTWNTDATYYYDPNGDGSNVGYWNNNGVGNLGLVSFRYNDNNVVKMFHETNGELIATLTAPRDGSAFNIYLGSNEDNHTADRIPQLLKYTMVDNGDDPSNVTGWYYIESPDGNFEYPLFATEAEANYIDGVEGGSNTSSTQTYVDDLSGTTWYKPTTNFVDNGTAAPQHGVYGNSINVLWNEIATGDDANYAPTFNDIVYTIQEGSAVNIQYKAQGMTDTFNITGVPTGYADNGTAIIGTAETITDGVDIQHVINVTKANDFGSDTGTITLNVTDDPTNNVSQNQTPWTKALDFSGSNEHAAKVSNWSGSNPLLMDSISQVLSGPSTVGNTSNASNARPWATAIVFKIDGNNSNQHIWNSGEGAGTGDDNIALRLSASKNLYLHWGRSGSENECQITSGGVLATNQWYGLYIAHNGTRLSASNATASNLADCFDIRLMSSVDSFNALGSNLSTSSTWLNTGDRMDRGFTGNFTIGGRGSNRNFHGKVASMVITTLRLGVAMPTDAEVKLMITDPRKWEDDYRIGQTVRRSQGSSNVTYANSSVYNGHGNTQIWLMGDSYIDSFANGIRNDVYHADQNYGKLQLNSMQSNDIVNVTINGLS